MKKLHFSVFLILTVLGVSDLFAQNGTAPKLYLRNGTLATVENISKKVANSSVLRNSSPDFKRLLIIQFNQIPDDDAIARLKNAGIELLEYVPDNAYTATVSGTLDYALLGQVNARSIIDLEPEQKVQPQILNYEIPGYAIKEEGKVDVRLSYAQSFSFEEVSNDLAKNHVPIISDVFKPYEILEVRVALDSVIYLATLPWVQYIELIPGPGEPLNDKSTAGTKANVLHSLSPSGYNLTGKGVVIGIGDFAKLSNHIDISKRVLSDNPDSNDWHGVHMAGTAAGSGIVNEKFVGYAPGASLVNRSNLEIWTTASSLIKDFGMTLTVNAYSRSDDRCGGFGEYGYDSYAIDRQAFEFPSLLHAFAGGNSGDVSCSWLPAGFGNILGESQSAKNVISVGQTTIGGVVAINSSKGPTSDGRIKPEITAPGTLIYSAFPVNRYGAASGTSMAVPAVAGGLALLYERYKQLHQKENPKNALMKALLLNGATDKGLPGPDYSYGFGSMNLLRSVIMLDRQSYMNSVIAHEESNVHEISVPSNTALLKVMLYWNDPAPSVLSGEKTLVNDLDLRVSKQGSPEILPSFPSYAAPQLAAQPGVDAVNNAEQIVIEKPEAGTYTFKVNGRKIPIGSQEYSLVYDIIETSTTLTYPTGAEHLTRGDGINICWESYGNSQSTFGLYYSLNNGDTWTTINAAVPAGSNQWGWTVPDGSTGLAKIRIVQNATGVTKESGTFSIIGVPVISLSPVQCETYVAVQWSAVAGASDYEVMILEGEEMKSVTTTTSLKYVFEGMSKDSTYYVSVRARKNGIPGRRALAVSRKPDSGTCEGSIFDNDLTVDAILSPTLSGRILTSKSLTAKQKIRIKVKNLDDQATNQPFQVGYTLGNEDVPIYWETVSTGIDKAGSLDYTFEKTANMQNEGSYTLRVFVKMPGDLGEKNNSAVIYLKQLTNPALTLPYLEDFESWPAQEVISEIHGLNGSDRYDFDPKTRGRLRTYVRPGLGYSGRQALTVGFRSAGSPPNTSYLDATYNLSAYKTERNDIRLIFRYALYNFWYEPGQVLIRGKDTDPWIEAMTFETYATNYKIGGINVTDLLARNAQEFTSSFQVRWVLSSYHQSKVDSHSIDDIRIYEAETDLEITRIGSPPIFCNGFQDENYSVTLRNNSSEDCFNVPVYFTIGNDSLAKQIIPIVPAHSDSTYILPVQPNSMTLTDYLLRVTVAKALDPKPENNFLEIHQSVGTIVSTFPYLENFENGDGGWQSSGTNNSWEYGKPDSPKVRGAASGQNAWKTNLKGAYHSEELSYLYSPCFQTTGLWEPSLSFSISLDLEECPDGACDAVYIEYFAHNEWLRLGEKDGGTNWYNTIGADNLGQWSVKDYTRWHVAATRLPYASFNTGSLRLRFVFKSNAGNNGEGIAIDDIHITSSTGLIYNDDAYRQFWQSALNPNVWSPFVNFSNNEIFASINPNNQDLGQVIVQTYRHVDNIRINNNQYYLGRSFKITADNVKFPEPVKVRLYVSDEEIERLLAAPDKTDVDKPKSAYELSITKYSGTNEDGDLLNDEQSAWSFYPKNAVIKVPYEKGYYFEFETKSFSEFWLAKDYVGMGPVLPVDLADFTAKKQSGTDLPTFVLLKWNTSSEKVFSHFEVEVATGDDRLKQNKFDVIGEVKGQGNSSVTNYYTFTDRSVKSSSTRYYRLKMVDIDKSVRYSSIRSVNFDQPVRSQIFPNPSKGKFDVELKSTPGDQVTFKIYNAQGVLIKNSEIRANGNIQKHEIDLSSWQFPSGLYLLRTASGTAEQTFKLVKE